MIDFFADDTVIVAIIVATLLYVAARVFFSFRFGFGKGGRGKVKKMDDAEAASFLSDTRVLANNLEAAYATANTLAEQTRHRPDEPLDLPRLEFMIPGRFQGDTRRLERLPAPYGPLAALAARKAQTLQFRLHDPNWEPSQRREGLDTPGLYDRMARDLNQAAHQARRVERLLRDVAPSPIRNRLKVVKR